MKIKFPNGIEFDAGGWIDLKVGKRKGQYYLHIKEIQRRNYKQTEKINVKIYNNDDMDVNVD